MIGTGRWREWELSQRCRGKVKVRRNPTTGRHLVIWHKRRDLDAVRATCVAIKAYHDGKATNVPTHLRRGMTILAGCLGRKR